MIRIVDWRGILGMTLLAVFFASLVRAHSGAREVQKWVPHRLPRSASCFQARSAGVGFRHVLTL